MLSDELFVNCEEVGVWGFLLPRNPAPPPYFGPFSIFLAYFDFVARFTPWHPFFGLHFPRFLGIFLGVFPLLKKGVFGV